MNGIKEWSAILCLAALASCMLEMIIPSGRMEKIMRFVLGGFLLCAMISPISNLDFHFPDLEVSGSSQAQSFSAHFEQQVVDAARDNVEGLVGQKLREAQIPYKKVEAVMDTSSSDSIGISKLIVTTDNPEDKIRIQKYLEEHLQIQTEVAVE